MKPFREEEIRTVQFLSDSPEGALSDAVRWLDSKDESGRENAFYFLDLAIENMAEVGWIVAIYCGKKVKLSDKRCANATNDDKKGLK